VSDDTGFDGAQWGDLFRIQSYFARGRSIRLLKYAPAVGA